MNFLPGTPLNADVSAQLDSRQKVFESKDGENRLAYQKLQSRVPWVKLTSCVNLSANHPMAKKAGYKAGTEFAESNALFSYMGDSDSRMTVDYALPGYRRYKDGADLGFRPQPGILNMDIKSHNRFGSLRTATVRFVCWTKEDMDKMEILYMRPGFSVLLEWGYSAYLNGNSVENDISTIEYKYLSTASKARAEIARKKKQYNYNYDAVLGLVKNFSWSLRPDGGYDCTTTIVTTGDILESYKANILFDGAKFNLDVQEEQTEYSNTHGGPFKWPSVSTDNTEDLWGADLSKTSTRAKTFEAHVNTQLQYIQTKWVEQLKVDTSAYRMTNEEVDAIIAAYPLKVVASGDKLLDSIEQDIETTVYQGGSSTTYSAKVKKNSANTVKSKNPLVKVEDTGIGGSFGLNILPWYQILAESMVANGSYYDTLRYVATDGSGVGVVVDEYKLIIDKIHKALETLIAVSAELSTDKKTPIFELTTPSLAASLKLGLYAGPAGGAKIGQHIRVASPSVVNSSYAGNPIVIKEGQSAVAAEYNYYLNRPRFIAVGYPTYDENQVINNASGGGSNTVVPEKEAFPITDLFVSKLNYAILSEIAQKVQADAAVQSLATDTNKISFPDTFNTVDLTSSPIFGSEYLHADDEQYKTRYGTILYGKLVQSGMAPSPASIHCYIKMGMLLSLLNDTLLKSKSERLFHFMISETDKFNYFTALDHISIDPTVCILPHSLKELAPSLASLESESILDIYLDVYFVSNLMKRFVDSKGQIAMLDFLESLFSEIRRVTGGVNDLGLQYYEETSTYTVVDRRRYKPVAKSSYTEVNIFGLSSVVKNVNLVSKLPPRIGTQIAISAQASPYSSMEEASGFDAINKGLTDYTYTTRKDRSVAESEDAALAYDKQMEVYRGQITGVITAIAEWYKAGLVSERQTNSTGQYENYMKTAIGAKKDNAYNFIIPFELQITLDGISNFRIMEAFRVSQDILPDNYGGSNGDIAFVVTGVEHKVDPKEWSTTIKSQIININETGSENLNKDVSKIIELAKLVEISSQAGGPGETANLDKGWEGKEQSFVRTVLTYAEAATHIKKATTNKNLQIAMLATIIREQGSGGQIKGFNHNYGGYDITSGGWSYSSFGPTITNGYVYATEGGTGRRKAFVSFISAEAFFTKKTSNFTSKGFQNAGDATACANLWYEKWNGYGARVHWNNNKDNIRSSYPTLAQYDAYVLDKFKTIYKTAKDTIG